MLETTRLRLRPCGTGDVGALHALWTDPVVRRWLWDDLVIPRSQAEEVVAASEASFASHGYGQWVVSPRDAEALIGFCGLRSVEAGGDVELLYGLLPAHHGAGLATEASRAVLAHGFGRVGLPHILGRVDSPNTASLAVLERLGMAFEGERLLDGRPTRHYVLSAEAFRGAASAGPDAA